MTSSMRTLVLALATLVGLTAACTTNRATLLGHWPAEAAIDARGAQPHYGVGVPRASEAAARWFQVEAERGVPEAQFNLGVMYSRGEGVDHNSEQAIRWLRKAESQGLYQAEVKLGSLYANGDAPEADPEEAARWLEAAAQAGNLEARRLLGKVYASVDPAPVARAQPPVAAAPSIVPLPPAPTVQTPEQALALADRYRVGDGVRKDPMYATRLYRRAAESGSAEAQQRLGSAYHSGVGVPRDYVLAYQWLSLSAASGDTQAHRELEEVESKLSSEHILDAQSLARKWYESNVETPR